MSKIKVNSPFFIFNPKSYLYGEELLSLAKEADKIAENISTTVFVTAPLTDISKIAEATENVIITSQHMSGIKPGRGMGFALADSIKHAGGEATFLNHAEHSLTTSELVESINRAKELDIISIACADSLSEAKSIAVLDPDIILCEPTDLIGTGETSDESYILETNKAIKSINPNILVMQAAGISNADDVYRTITLGAEGTGATSGIIKAEDQKRMLKEMIEAVEKAKKEQDDSK